jgi:small-conductance mechanosensitive channel
VEFLTGYLDLPRLIPSAIGLVVVIVVLFAVRRILDKRLSRVSEGRFRLQLTMLGFSLAAAIAIIMVLPISDNSRAQLLGLVGVLLSAAIALSSTTFLGNIMAGVTLRAVKAFRTGDFVRVGEHFGRVSERGLFHVEIQTEDRDLTTLPNLFLVTQPVTVIDSTGTIVSTTLSLGYDVPQSRIKDRLLDAARNAGLEEPFVQILELGDFSVTYRIAGLYKEVKQILSKRSELRSTVLEALHGAGIEIVSPNFMNTRAIPEGQLFIPSIKRRTGPEPQETEPESIVFDKAEHAELLENLRDRLKRMLQEIKQQEELLGKQDGEEAKARIENQIKRLKIQRERLELFLENETKEEEK